MAIQYYMRAFNTSLSRFVDWVVNDTPDSTGTFSGYPIGQLVNITVNRVVQSKVSNFLKNNQSLGGTDGYHFHVNSYDWKNAVPPISPPTNFAGIAVERGITPIAPSSAVTTATNASPINITLGSPSSPALVTGQLVTIAGATGNTNANGTWPIVVTSSTTFDLVGSVGNGIYTGSGNAYLPTDTSTLTWDEANNIWKFVVNTNGDGTTLGASQSVSVNNFLVGGFIGIGPDPADSGAIRLSNNTFINWEANPTGTDIQGIGVDNLNRIKLGSLTTDQVYIPGVVVVDGYVQHDGTGNDTPLIGFIRDKNNTTIVAFRKQDLSGDIAALSSTSGNVIVLGDAVNLSINYNTSTGSLHQFQVNSIPDFEIGSTFARFTNTVIAPTINQTANGVGLNGQTLFIQSQNAGAGSTTGGILSLSSGTGGNFSGTVDLSTGGTLKMRIFPTTAGVAADNNSISLFENKLRFDTAQVTPLIRQDDVVASSTNGQSFTLQSQNATGTTSIGGVLNLTSGTGTTNSGLVNVQTGGVTQIIVSPLTVPPGTSGPATTGTVIIKGNLEVVGTTTTVDSTVVDIIGRVIHANWADPTASLNVGVPTQNVGYSIHRGNGATAGSPRDGAALIWTEGTDAVYGSDGYWRALTISGDGYGTDNFTFANSPYTLGVFGKSFISSTDPNPVNGTLPNVGSLRLVSNASAAVARNTQVLTTVSASSNLASLPQGTINVTSTTGFTSNGGTILVISSAGPQTIAYTATSGGNQFTGCTGGAGTLALGSSVAQTNASTTIAAGSNNVTLPNATINVASTSGFPATGTIRIQTVGPSGGVQTITYTNVTGTSFTGCTGGTGTLITGAYVNSPPIAGTADILLLGTDFGNRITHGDGYAPNNAGHIFSTTTNSIFDFWVNAVTQVQLGGNTDPLDSFVQSISIGPTVNTPKIYQIVQPNTGANNGFNLKLQAQAGQQQAGGSTNNNGGNVILASGLAGTGGAGAAGINGTVDIQTGSTLKMRVFATDASPVGSSVDDNSILYFESLFRVDTAQVGIGPLAGTGIRFRQDDTAGATGQVYTIQAQNAATTGGNLVLTSGVGSSATNAGQVKLSTGSASPSTSIDRVIVYPTGAPVLPQGPSGVGIPYTEFRDTAQAVFITPVFNGISSLGFASTVLGAQIAQVATTTTNGAPMTIQAQVSSFNGGTGGNLVLIAGNETGTTSTGGNINLTSGSGTSTNGVVNILIGGNQAIIFNNTDSDASGFSEVMTIASTIGTPRIFQATTGSASGTILALMAQSAATTGGPLQLHSGAGATNDGYINLTTGNTVKMTIFPTTAVSAANNNSVLLFENKFRFDTAQVTPLIRQDDKIANGGTGEVFTVQAQNETGTTSTGGALVLTSGTGTTVAGNTQLQTGGVDRVVVHPTFTEFRDTAEALRITPVSAGTTQITFAATDTAAQINQTLTAATPSAPMTIQSQVTTAASGVGGNITINGGNATGTTSTGGNAIITSGTGTTVAGNVQLQTGTTDRVVVHPTFTEFRDTAEAFRITPVSAGTTQLTFAATDTAVQINQTSTASTPSANMTIQSQVTTAVSGVGGNLNVTAGNATNTTSTGGDLNLSSGSGTTTNGNLNLQAGGSTTARVHTNKLSFLKGWRRNITAVSTTYQMLVTDDYIAATTSSAYTITMPATPTTGDTYTIKDASGGAGTNTLTISGNSVNIDGSASIVLNQAYAAVTLTYTGSQWSVT